MRTTAKLLVLMEKVRRTAILYYLLQGLAVACWWIVLFGWPDSRAYFLLEADSETSLLAFFLPDAVFIAVGSLVAAYLIYSRNRYTTAALWLLTGAISYATAYTFSFALLAGHGWLGVTLMLPAMLWTGVFATVLTVEGEMFRQAKTSSAKYVLLKTFTQIAVVWTVILFVFPYLITIIEGKLGIPRLEFAFQRPIAAALFLAVSGVGVYSAVVMSRIGKGTPLPLDHASDLVVLGPYAYVRNPMAVSGIGQGLAVALFLGSPLVAVYALIGSAIWQLVFRPMEEDDLSARFGEPYSRYCEATKCWVPRRTPYDPKLTYQMDGTADSSNSVVRPSGSM
ncbi:MAG: isoprenylcysteine carboxylmethyltransferase family protein [Pyrinomonadaceae bacterium]